MNTMYENVSIYSVASTEFVYTNSNYIGRSQSSLKKLNDAYNIT